MIFVAKLNIFCFICSRSWSSGVLYTLLIEILKNSQSSAFSRMFRETHQKDERILALFNYLISLRNAYIQCTQVYIYNSLSPSGFRKQHNCKLSYYSTCTMYIVQCTLYMCVQYSASLVSHVNFRPAPKSSSARVAIVSYFRELSAKLNCLWLQKVI